MAGTQRLALGRIQMMVQRARIDGQPISLETRQADTFDSYGCASRCPAHSISQILEEKLERLSDLGFPLIKSEINRLDCR